MNMMSSPMPRRRGAADARINLHRLPEVTVEQYELEA